MRLAAATIDDAVLRTYEEILRTGNEVASSRGKNREIVGVEIELSNPRARLCQAETLPPKCAICSVGACAFSNAAVRAHLN